MTAGSTRPVVLDTSALLYWSLEPSALTAAARTAIDTALPRAGCVVSAISLWEIALKARQGRLQLGLTPVEFADRLARVKGLEIRAVDTRTWLHSVGLDWAHRDPADRVIVATAALLRAPLVTSDAEIRGFYACGVW